MNRLLQEVGHRERKVHAEAVAIDTRRALDVEDRSEPGRESSYRMKDS